jgi:hypothetical protein
MMVDGVFVYRTSALGNIVLNPSSVLNKALVALEQFDSNVVQSSQQRRDIAGIPDGSG